jgi:Holliday junction resolvase
MRFRLLLLCAAISSPFPLFARDKTDVIIMKNGDHVTCEIKGLRSNTLYISVDYILSTLSVDWSKVDHVQSKQLFLIRTQDGTVYTGALSTPDTSGGRPLQIEVVESPGEKVTLEREQVVRVNETSSNFWQRLNGHIGTGFTYSKGNDSTQYNLSSDVNYPRERWSAEASYSSNFTSNSGASTSTRNEVGFSALHLLRWNNWYYTGVTDFLQSSVQGIQLQSTFGGGIGRIIKNTGSTSLTLYSGFAWQRINYKEAANPSLTQQVTSGLIGSSLKLFRFDRTTLTLNATFLPAVSDPGRFHFNLNTSYYVKLWGKLDWNFTFYGNLDNRPPPGFSSSDYGTTSGLSLSFGNH